MKAHHIEAFVYSIECVYILSLHYVSLPYATGQGTDLGSCRKNGTMKNILAQSLE